MHSVKGLTLKQLRQILSKIHTLAENMLKFAGVKFHISMQS